MPPLGDLDIKLIFEPGRRCWGLLRLLQGLAQYCSTSGNGPVPLGRINKNQTNAEIHPPPHMSYLSGQYFAALSVLRSDRCCQSEQPAQPIYFLSIWAAQTVDMLLVWAAQTVDMLLVWAGTFRHILHDWTAQTVNMMSIWACRTEQVLPIWAAQTVIIWF